jgi:hypothetical protein
MAKVKLVLTDVVTLNVELFNIQHEKDLSFRTKFELGLLGQETKKIVENYQKQQEGLFKEYGKETKKGKGDWKLEKGTAKGDKGFKELEDLMAVESELELNVDFEEFEELRSDKSYVTIMKFLTPKK